MVRQNVYQLTKQLNIASDEVLSFLKVRNIEVRSIMTPLDLAVVEEVLEHFKKDQISADRKIAIKKKRQKVHEGKREKILLSVPIAENLVLLKDITFTIPTITPLIIEPEKPVVAPRKVVTPAPSLPVSEPIVKTKELAARVISKEPVVEKTGKPPKKEVHPKTTVPVKEVTPQEEVVLEQDQDVQTKEITPVVEEEPFLDEEEIIIRDRGRKLSEKGKRLTEKIHAVKKPQIDESEDILAHKKSKRKKRRKKKKFDEKEIQASIKVTMARMGEGFARKKYRKTKDQSEEVEIESNVLKVPEFTSVAELANMMDVEPNDVIKKLIEMGVLVSINQRLDMDTITMVADEFGFDVEKEDEFGVEKLEAVEEQDDENNIERPPVVTIMGHVDHGKTSFLDYVRKSNIVAGEVGGITQHIGAYEVEYNNRKITFLDTPGHEAFTAMRARGAKVTDIVVLVIAAEDNVMPQTVEAINHARSASVPIIIALNKIDKPAADPDRIRKQLADRNILVESWGGKYPEAEVSAKTGEGVSDLLELILIQAELLELEANPSRLAKGVVIESKLDKGRGIIATILVQNGSMKIGDSFICGQYSGKVRALFNERGNILIEAGPSTPAQVLGFSGVPQAGDTFMVMESEREAREISLRRQQLRREHDYRRIRPYSLDEISKQIKSGTVKELVLIVKADTDGSAEALADSLMKLGSSEVKVNIVHKGVGEISETDVLLASAANAIIIGFYVRPNLKARELAEREVVDIRLYTIIYAAISEVKDALEGLLEPEIREDVVGSLEVRQTFKISGTGLIAGCWVASGKIARSDNVRVVRDGKSVYEGRISSLKRFKDDAREVLEGLECGVGIENFNDVKMGDTIECFTRTKIKKTL